MQSQLNSLEKQTQKTTVKPNQRVGKQIMKGHSWAHKT